ncbi:unnamed protein product [Bursaphelenchus okinawaensis]|uniref:Uncharacterized protein n=1 Tax=Bursaphelenchus okinawaensis TaxID=465554 RepID=A0A811LLL7_9BILA|nr:unnamed protein product [Bursaphelenchus okinawaensis]CAG9126509.1 unnamed protein product [Bursaphelenchus okinawaensis]
MFYNVFFVALLTVIITNGFKIPIPFGSIDYEKDKDGNVDAGINSDINIMGSGASSGFNVEKEKNGTFALKPQLGITANNTYYGSNSTFGVDKEKGIQADSDVEAGKNTFHGGVGKESQFINEVGTAVEEKKKNRHRRH